MSTKKYVSLSKLSTFLDNLKTVFATQEQLDAKAADVHDHDASNITSGTLSTDILPTVPISKGGTGATTAVDALTNLGITATADELNTLDGITVTTDELNYMDGVKSSVQAQLDAKATVTITRW